MKLFIISILFLSSCATIFRTNIEPEPQPNKPQKKEAINKTKKIKRIKIVKNVVKKVYPDSIKVAITWDQKDFEVSWKKNATVELYSNGMLIDKIRNRKISILYISDENFIVKGSGIRLNFSKPVILKCKNGKFIYNKSTYRGEFIIKAIKNKGLYLINNLLVEDYLLGVVPNEMGKKKQAKYQQALQAQAIVARSYTYAKIGKYSKFGFDLKASVADQVYRGMSSEFSQCTKAVNATKGKVMEYNNKPIVAYYHSTCGGKTSSFDECWFGLGKIDYLKTRNDFAPDGSKYCKKSFKSNWTVKYPKWELKKNLKLKYKINGITDIKITKFTRSGRVHTLIIYDDNNTGYEFHGDKLRWVFKKKDKILPSSMFTIKEDKTNYYFVGHGYGHGVGMCQFGAMGRSEAGQTAKQILNAYYSNIKIVNINKIKQNKVNKDIPINKKTNNMIKAPDNFDDVLEF